MSKLLETLAIGALLTVTPLTSFAETYPACESEPSEEEVQAAKGAFMAGKAAFDEADYERAITYWSDAYRRDCTAHDLLRNLARAFELSGQKQAAIEALRVYLERVPDTDKTDQFQRRIEKLEGQLAEEAETQPPAEELEPPVATAPTPPQPTSPSPTQDGTTSPSGRKPVGPLVIAGVGGAVAIVGSVGYATEAGSASDYEDQCGPERDACPSAQVEADADAWRSRQIGFSVTTWVGVGVAGTGLIWYLASPRKAPKEAARHGRLTVRPAVSPRFGGVSLAGQF